MEVLNDHTGQDAYLLRSYNYLPLSNGVHVEHISWQLDDYSATALSSDDLPITPPVLVDWPDTWAHLTIFGYCNSYFLRAEVTSAIPEPATILLLTLGSLFLTNRRRYRRIKYD